MPHRQAPLHRPHAATEIRIAISRSIWASRGWRIWFWSAVSAFAASNGGGLAFRGVVQATSHVRRAPFEFRALRRANRIIDRRTARLRSAVSTPGQGQGKNGERQAHRGPPFCGSQFIGGQTEQFNPLNPPAPGWLRRWQCPVRSGKHPSHTSARQSERIPPSPQRGRLRRLGRG